MVTKLAQYDIDINPNHSDKYWGMWTDFRAFWGLQDPQNGHNWGALCSISINNSISYKYLPILMVSKENSFTPKKNF